LYEAYLALRQFEMQNSDAATRGANFGKTQITNGDIQKIIEEGTRWLLQKWQGLPEVVFLFFFFSFLFLKSNNNNLIFYYLLCDYV